MKEQTKDSQSAQASDTDRWVSFTLRIGVWISSVLMALGLLLASLHSSSGISSNQSPTLPELVAQLFSKKIFSAGGAQAAILLYTGLVVLMITPYFRVVTTVTAFAAQKDWKFVGVALIVLTLLVLELVLSLG